MELYKERVLSERVELELKIVRLDLFMRTLEFSKLSSTEQGLMHHQLSAMRMYMHALNERITLWSQE